MSLVILIGAPAAGKMTVGQALEAQTGLRLFHNHMTIELVLPFFSYSSDEGRALVARLREETFRAVAKSDLPGMIFTYVWAFDHPSERAYIEGLAGIFSDAGHRVCWVELLADLDTRLARNTTANRLRHKPSKRDLAASEAELRRSDETYRLTSLPGELDEAHVLRLDTTEMSAEESAQAIKAHFDL